MEKKKVPKDSDPTLKKGKLDLKSISIAMIMTNQLVIITFRIKPISLFGKMQF